MINPVLLLLGIFILSALGFLSTFLFSRTYRPFVWVRYVLLVGVPVTGCFTFAVLHDVRIAYLFLTCAIAGTALEYTSGRAYHIVMGERLWRYHTMVLPGGYSSILAFPLWGMGGVVSWLIAVSLGL